MVELDQSARDSFHNASIALTKLISRQLSATEMTSEEGGYREEEIGDEEDEDNSSSEDEIEEEDVHEMRAFM